MFVLTRMSIDSCKNVWKMLVYLVGEIVCVCVFMSVCVCVHMCLSVCRLCHWKLVQMSVCAIVHNCVCVHVHVYV